MPLSTTSTNILQFSQHLQTFVESSQQTIYSGSKFRWRFPRFHADFSRDIWSNLAERSSTKTTRTHPHALVIHVTICNWKKSCLTKTNKSFDWICEKSSNWAFDVAANVALAVPISKFASRSWENKIKSTLSIVWSEMLSTHLMQKSSQLWDWLIYVQI